MGLLSATASAFGIAGSIGSAVFSLVKNAGGLAGTILKSKAGKFAIGAGAAAILFADPTNSGHSLFSKIGEGFKSFLGSMKDSVASKLSNTGLKAAAFVTGAGKAANDISDNVKEIAGSTDGVTLRDAVIDGASVTADNTAAPPPEHGEQDVCAEAEQAQPSLG